MMRYIQAQPGGVHDDHAMHASLTLQCGMAMWSWFGTCKTLSDAFKEVSVRALAVS